MTATTPQTAKDKGRRFQKEIAEAIRNALDLPKEDVISRPMGSPGADIILSDLARRACPFSIECKRTERPQLAASWKQTKANAEKEGLHPCLAVRRNRAPTVILVENRILRTEVHTKPLIFASSLHFSKVERMIEAEDTGIIPTKVIGTEYFAICSLHTFLKLLQDEAFIPPNSPNFHPAQEGKQ